MKLHRTLSITVFLGFFLFINLFIFSNKVVADINYDINSDSVIDIKDLGIVASKYNMKNTYQGWEPRYDLNSDNIIDIFDLSLLSKHIGTPYTDNTKLGNSFGNINNSGLFFSDNDWTYYSNIYDSRYLYKIKKDGTQNTMLNFQPSSNINVASNYIFYTNSQDNNRIYRMNTDGSNILCINKNDSAKSLIAYDGYIYYINYTDSEKIYRIKFDGSEPTRITDDTYCNYINIAGNYLYYSAKTGDGVNGGPIYRINLDGTNRKLINEDKCSYEILKDGTIYYINVSDNYNLYKMNFDGTDRKKLNDDHCHFLNISNNVIYYTNTNDGNKIYAIKTDGTSRTPVTTEAAYYLNIAGNQIYYKTKDDYGDTHSTSLINLDKSEMPSDANSLGNLPGNINNEAFCGSDGKYIYVNEYGIYRYDNDYTNKFYIGNGTYSSANYINVLNGWIYYSTVNTHSTSEGGKIYKVKADGSGKSVELSANGAYYMTVAGEWIYYTTREEDSRFTGSGPIHKVKIDGTGETYVDIKNFDYATYLNISGDYIYYVNNKDNNTIYKVKTDGTGRVKVVDEPARGLNVMNGYIYYNSDYYGKLKRVSISGGNPVTIKENVYENFIVTSDKVYYANLEAIYSSNLDGSSEVFITKCDLGSRINIAGDYLFYIDTSSRPHPVKIH